ncbi:Cob(I)yrinic acid a,c-diamide adenosyltransferase, mitochondrial [Zancudomyces culisetae]|uniref:Corrinoid adenosyltransferase MMAB n=1 Tax=Zancudomyces culisetae TaxID=1213189 RepID=A0A1R1PUH9_ZANCU|nr:Cob(I)yrinic acid a,c-diamide adenosyltransferase, mitochondrial [Zancudomyces culisetae]|eukprot:OMH84625.1 Cob(I)yrinic acid a,c-diamide adenosyltransferase, mitochondrial [Zancudomyces culisetae]
MSSVNKGTVVSEKDIEESKRVPRIYTRTGDKGTSQLYSGERFPKSHYVFEALGTIDELSSSIGCAICHLETNPRTQEVLVKKLVSIQCILQDICSSVATVQTTTKTEKLLSTKFVDGELLCKELEGWIDELELHTKKLTNFVLPSGGLSATQLHIARTICRRAERVLSSVIDQVDQYAYRYMNRLSDFLFVAARASAALDNIDEKVYFRQKRE